MPKLSLIYLKNADPPSKDQHLVLVEVVLDGHSSLDKMEKPHVPLERQGVIPQSSPNPYPKLPLLCQLKSLSQAGNS
jgi:hypothetical protein